ncbi:hypothetical protein [Acidianus sp. RZ1]|uniref:hypothetical protein n=1 Tax=Acidianus sp. RZ1 TaxID=1540082 RepID=UPI001491FD89|nr:hypothetical protein [Acidianus sp. RZ1]NON61212.1 hypothetical protein [Acidianus sp. RZ1]
MRSLLLSSWVYGFGMSLSSSVLGLYLYVNSSLYSSLLFLLFNSISIFFTYIMVGFLSSKVKDALTYYRLGIATTILFYFILIYLGHRTFLFIPYLGTLYGFAQGLYWSGWDIIFYYRTNKKLQFFNRSAYLGAITTLAGPAIVGSILTFLGNSGYVILFILSTSILLLTLVLVESAHLPSTNFDLKNSLRKHIQDSAYGRMLISLTLVAGFNYIAGYVNPIILFSLFKNYEDFSIVNYFLSTISLISVYLRGKLAKLYPTRIYFIASVFILYSSIMMFFDFRTALLYLFSYSVLSPLIYPLIDVDVWDLMNGMRLMEYLVNRQIFLNSSRITFSMITYVAASSLEPTELIVIVAPLLLTSALIYKKFRPVKDLT